MSTFHIPELPASLNRELELSSKAAKLLLDARYRKVLRFFAREATTVSALAQHLEVPTANAYYYVKGLHQAGMLEVVASRQRTGKPIKLYACSADSYFVPNQVAPLALKEFLAAADAPWREVLERSIEHHVYEREGWGLRLFRDTTGTFHTAFTPRHNWRDFAWLEAGFTPDESAIFAALVPLKLNRERAKALQTELGQIFQRYYLDTVTDESKPSYVLRLELAPISS